MRVHLRDAGGRSVTTAELPARVTADEWEGLVRAWADAGLRVSSVEALVVL